LLKSAQSPLIVAGGGVSRSGAFDELIAFAELTNIPVMTAFRRHDVFPNDHPLFLGGLSFGSAAPTVERATTADVVLAIGTRLSELTTMGYRLPGSGAKLVHIDISGDELGKSYPAAVAIAADAKAALESLISHAKSIAWGDAAGRNGADRARFLDATTPPQTPAIDYLVDPAVVVTELQKQLPADAVLTSDAGNFYTWVGRYYRFNRPGTFLGPTSGAMGYAVPAAVAAAIVRNGSAPGVALAGDGGFLMTANELAVAGQLGLRVICVVFDNSMYGTIRLHQERTYPERVSGTDLWSPDFVKMAEAFGGLGVRVERNQDVAEAVRQVVAHEGVSILSVAVAREHIAVGQKLGAIAPKQRRR
jgi:acetolactate synthase-1/2/3 large subunit